MKRGDVRWCIAADKRRPVVILTRDSAIGYLSSLTVAPVTTTIRRIPSEVSLAREDGMPEDCVITCDNLLTVPKQSLGPLIATLSAGKLAAVARAVSFALGFDEWA